MTMQSRSASTRMLLYCLDFIQFSSNYAVISRLVDDLVSNVDITRNSLLPFDTIVSCLSVAVSSWFWTVSFFFRSKSQEIMNLERLPNEEKLSLCRKYYLGEST